MFLSGLLLPFWPCCCDFVVYGVILYLFNIVLYSKSATLSYGLVIYNLHKYACVWCIFEVWSSDCVFTSFMPSYFAFCGDLVTYVVLVANRVVKLQVSMHMLALCCSDFVAYGDSALLPSRGALTISIHTS